jgi:hypothetical protein
MTTFLLAGERRMGMHEDARRDHLVIFATRQEVEAGELEPVARLLMKLLLPETAKTAKGRVLFGIKGYDDDPRQLWEVPGVRSWMRQLDALFPYWFYFLDTGPRSTLGFVAFSLCAYEKVPGGSHIPPEELQEFLRDHFVAMNGLCAVLGETAEENDARTEAITRYFFPRRADA